MPDPKFSVAGYVSVGLVAAATLLLGGLGFAGYNSFSARERADFARGHAIIADQLGTSVALPLWNFDREQLGKVIESGMQHAEIEQIEVVPRGTSNRTERRNREHVPRPAAATAPRDPRDEHVERRAIVVAGETIGDVRVFATDRFLRTRLRQAAFAIVAVIGLFDAVLVIGLYLLLWRLVLRPLRELEHYALNLPARQAAPDALPKGRYVGELAGLRAAIERMIALLETRYIEASKSEARHRLLAENLRESEEKFSRIFRVSPISILITDLQTGEIIDANEAFLRTFETNRGEAIGRTTLELGLWSDPVDRERLKEQLHQGFVRDFRVRERTVRGRPITALINSGLVELGDRTCILTMVLDVTLQERAEEALRESEEKFSKAFRAGPDAMAIAEFERGLYLEINQGFEKLFGYTRSEVIGRTSLELGIWREEAARERFITVLRDQGSVRDLEVSSVTRFNEPITYLLSAECMEFRGRTCIVSVIHDITDRKRAEAEHARALDRERTAREAFTRQLIAAQETERRRIAGELHDSLGQNLLLVKNRAQLALGDPAMPDSLRWQFESIADMATQAIAEVRQISHDLRPYQLDQLGLTRALKGMIESAARNTGFAFEARIDAADDVFQGEAATHLFRIVQESMNNILKHARATTARIVLERDVRDVRLTISDAGIGFAPAPEAAGTPARGLGLRNIAERVRILGGSLQVDSAPGRGTRLAIVIPLPEDTEPIVH